MSEAIRCQATGRESLGEHSLLCHGGISFSIIETSAVRTPTVTYKVPGVTEAMEDGKNGKLVEDGNERQMVESIRKSWINILAHRSLPLSVQRGSIHGTRPHSYGRKISKQHVNSLSKMM